MESVKKKILLVEDDSALNYIIHDNLEEAGYKVEAADDGEKALALFQKEKFDLCLVDVMLPKIDGFTLAKKIRENDANIPVLFVTAKSLPEDKLTGFGTGGDDYITKPFSMDELLMRIKVFLRRSGCENDNGAVTRKYQIGRYVFCSEDLSLISESSSRILTFKEMQLLTFFCEHSNKVLKRSDILNNVWGSDDYYLGRSLDVFISRLRKYFGDDPSIRIINLHGVGFRFVGAIEQIKNAL